MIRKIVSVKKIKNKYPSFIVTGLIASGKSIFAKMLSQYLDASTADADRFAHDALTKCSDIVVKEFGSDILGSDNSIDRKRLGLVVFSDKEKLLKLENILHPEVNKDMSLFIENANEPTVLEIVLLEKSMYKDIENKIVVYVDSEYEKILSRIVSRGHNEEVAKKIIESQSAIAALKNRGDIIDIVIENNLDLKDLRDKAYILSKNYEGILNKK